MRWSPLLLALLTLLPAARGSAPAAGEAPVSIHVVVLGSSTAAGVGPSHPDSAWVNRYRRALRSEYPDHRVTNLARGGYTTYHILPAGGAPRPGRPEPDTLRNITRALGLHPDAIIINLPSNDAACGYRVDEQLANYDSVLAAAGRTGVPVWIATTQPRGLDARGRKDLMALRDSTLTRFARSALDFWTGIAGADGTIDPRYDCGDGIHLNDAGHRILCERATAAHIPRVIGTITSAPTRKP